MNEIASEHPPPQVELLPVVLELAMVDVDGRTVRVARSHRQPVRDVDDRLVAHHDSGDLAVEPVVNAGEVGARIVRTVSPGARRGTTATPVSVGERTERLSEAFGLRVVAAVRE